jgi:hypothetical protein
MADAFDSPTVPWGADTTVNAGKPPMSGAEFDALRERGIAERAGVRVASDGANRQQSPYEQLGNELGPGCGLPALAARVLAREISALIDRCNKLEGHIEALQSQLARKNPPHLAKIEKRTA